MFIEMINLLKSEFCTQIQRDGQRFNMMFSIASDFGEGDLI